MWLRHRNNYLNHTEAITIEAKLIKVVEDLFKNEVLNVLREATTLKDFTNDMSALIILWQMEDVILKGFSDENFFFR